jgi:hypothetical protein
MKARRKIEQPEQIQNDELRSKLSGLSFKKKEIEAMLEDVHLIEAALATDYTVVSRDETVRAFFRQASKSVTLLRPVTWVNPTREEEECIDWLKHGAPSEKRRQLGFEEEEA